MKIIIVGMSKVGLLLVKNLSNNPEFDITVIDNVKEEVDKATELYNVNGVCGSGSSRTILLNAGIESADVIIALTPIDEVNITCCMIGKNCGARYTCAIVHSIDFEKDIEYLQKSIDYVINPRLITAQEVFMQIGLPGKCKVDALFGKSAIMLKTTITNNLKGKSMIDVKKYFEQKVLIGAVRRNKEIYIPNGTFVLEDNDEIEMIVEKEYLPAILEKLNLPQINVNNVLIIGCGTTGYFLSQKITENKMNLKIIDSNLSRCKELSDIFPNAKISYINDAEKLMMQDLKNIDVCILLTDKDDSNIVNSLYAWSKGIKSIIMRVNSPQYEKLLNKTDFQITVSPAVTTVDKILSFIRNIAYYNDKGDDIKQIRLIFNASAETIEFIAYDNCKVLNIPFSSPDFKIKKNVLIAIIIRDGQTIIPDGKSDIKCNDKVIVITKTGGKYNTLNDIFM